MNGLFPTSLKSGCYDCSGHACWLLFYTSQSCHRRRRDDKGGQKLIQSKAESDSGALPSTVAEKYGIGTGNSEICAIEF